MGCLVLVAIVCCILARQRLDFGCLKCTIFLHVWDKLTALQVDDSLLAALPIDALSSSWPTKGVADAQPGAKTIVVGPDKLSMSPTDPTLSIHSKRALRGWSGIQGHPAEAGVL